MNITLNAEELLHIYEILINNPMQDKQGQSSLLSKVRRPILNSLERTDEEESIYAFEAWSRKESEKIEELEVENEELMKEIVSRPLPRRKVAVKKK